MRHLLSLPILTLLVTLSMGCATTDSRTRDVRMTSELRALRADVDRLKARMEASEEAQAQIYANLQELRTSTADVTEAQGQRVAAIEQNVAGLSKQQSADRRKLYDDLSKKIAGMVSQVQSVANTATRASSGYEHVVSAGDTLSGIAQEYGVTIKAITAANDLRGDIIRVGQKLFVPDP